MQTKSSNLIKILISSVLVFANIIGLGAPVFAGLGLPVFEDPPKKGARIYIKDQASIVGDASPAQFVDLYIDLGINDNESEYIVGKMPVYGNGEDNYNGQYSYNTLGLVIDQDNEETPVIEFGFAVYDWTANSYRTTLYSKVGSNYRKYHTDVLEKQVKLDDLSNTLSAVFDVASSKPVVEEDLWTDLYDSMTTKRILIEDTQYLTSGISVDSTNIHKGEADQISKFLDQIYVYWQTESKQRYYYATGLTKSTDAEHDSIVKPPRNLIARAYGSRGTVTYLPPEDPKGIVGYQVDIEDGNGKRMTHQNILFFQTEPGESHKIEVWSLNMEGDESSLITKDIESQTDQTIVYLKDINSAPYFKNYIGYGYKLNYWEGYSDKTFRPDDPVTRQALAAFVYKAMRGAIPFNALKTEGKTFSDIDIDNQFFSFVQSLKNAGILVGFSDGTFRPNNVVTRAEGATYIHNTFKAISYNSLRNVGNTCFSDTTQTIHGIMICSLARSNNNDFIPIIAGYSSGAFGYQDPLTRAQMATILLKSMALIDIDPASSGHQSMLTDGTSKILASEGMGYNVPDSIYAGGQSGYTLDFSRPFVPSIPIEGLKKHAIATHAVELEWRNLRKKDDSVDGFLVERRNKGTNAWEEVEGVYYDSANTEFQVTLRGSIPSGTNIDVIVTLNGQNTDLIGIVENTDALQVAEDIRDYIVHEFPSFSETTVSGSGETGYISVKSDSSGNIGYEFPEIPGISYQIDTLPEGLVGASASGIISTESNAEFTINVAGSVSVTKSGFIVKVNQNETTLDLLEDETNIDIASKLATAINRISGVSAQLIGSSVKVVSDIAGAKLTYTLPNTSLNGITLNSTPASPVSPDREGILIKGGYIPAIDFENTYLAKVTDMDIYAGDTYEYRVRAIKWVPFPFSDEGYANQGAMLADSQINADTIMLNAVISEDSIVEIVVPLEREVF